MDINFDKQIIWLVLIKRTIAIGMCVAQSQILPTFGIDHQVFQLDYAANWFQVYLHARFWTHFKGQTRTRIIHCWSISGASLLPDFFFFLLFCVTVVDLYRCCQVAGRSCARTHVRIPSALFLLFFVSRVSKVASFPAFFLLPKSPARTLKKKTAKKRKKRIHLETVSCTSARQWEPKPITEQTHAAIYPLPVCVSRSLLRICIPN